MKKEEINERMKFTLALLFHTGDISRSKLAFVVLCPQQRHRQTATICPAGTGDHSLLRKVTGDLSCCSFLSAEKYVGSIYV